MLELAGGGIVINGATPSIFFQKLLIILFYITIQCINFSSLHLPEWSNNIGPYVEPTVGVKMEVPTCIRKVIDQ